jgi:hypothetical protein
MMKIIESDGFIERAVYHNDIGRIYVFDSSQFLNHFLKNGIFACRHCLYKTALPNISHIYCLLKLNALKNDAFVPWNIFSYIILVISFDNQVY